MSRPLEVIQQGAVLASSIVLLRRGVGFRHWMIDCVTKRPDPYGIGHSMTFASDLPWWSNAQEYTLYLTLGEGYVTPYLGPWREWSDGATEIRLPLPAWGPGWTVTASRTGKYEVGVMASRDSWWYWLKYEWRMRRPRRRKQ